MVGRVAVATADLPETRLTLKQSWRFRFHALGAVRLIPWAVRDYPGAHSC
jgi:hypothetical protein